MMERNLYAGSYTTYPPAKGEDVKSLSLLKIDLETGRLVLVESLDAGPNASFMAFHPHIGTFYISNELAEGEVSAYATTGEGAKIRFINRQPVQGADPCYLTVDPTGRWLLAACYSSGSLSIFPLDQDGRIGPIAQRILHTGSGPNKDRQEQAHVHCVRFDPSGRYLFVVDLGMDRVWVYRMDAQTGALEANDPPGLDTQPGAGPRHIAFHPKGQYTYIVNELTSTVTACAWDQEAGVLKSLQTYPATRGEYSEKNTGADIHLTPNGEFLYVSVRGENTLAAYRVDQVTGLLTPIGIFSCGGNWPRNFAISPEGKFLVVANQFSQDLIVFRILKDGRLQETGEQVKIPAPVCVYFV